MTPKKTIGTNLTIPIADQTTGDSQGKLSLEVFYVGLTHTLIKQKPNIRCELFATADNKLNLAKAWYEEGMSGVEDHVQKIQFSGDSAELDFEPISTPNITVILLLDARGLPMGSSVGGGSSGTPLQFSYDNVNKKIVASRPNKSILLVTYQTSWCMIRYTPWGQINLAGGTTTTYGSLYAYHAVLLPNQEDTSECAVKPARIYFAEIDLEPPPMDGDDIEIASVKSEFINWEDKAYEIPPNYPGTTEEDRRVPAGSQGGSVILPKRDDGETWQFPRVHHTYTMNTYSGVVSRHEFNPALAHPYAPELWENISSYQPKFAFSSTRPSGEHAAQLFDKVDWDSIKEHVRKTFPGCEGV